MKKLNIIALLGKARAGKDTSGAMLLEMGEGRQMAYADKLKSIAGEMFGLSNEDMYTDEGKKRKTEFDCLMCPSCKTLECHEITLDRVKMAECKICKTVGALSVFKSKWTVRTILQYLGTEGFRRIDPGVWVRYALNEAEEELTEDSDNDFVVITDCRFRSEAQAVWAVGGEVWRIRRPEAEKQQQGIAGHASEAEQDSIADAECQAVIENNGTLDDLRAKLFVQFERFTAARAKKAA